MNSFDYHSFLTRFGDVERATAPNQLFIEGNTSLLTSGRKVAVVGSRKPTTDGIRRARSLVKMLVDAGITVVSGMAEGIDTVAHETAMSHGGSTIAVLGTPLDVAYPKKNFALLERIKQDYLAISQFPTGYPTLAKNFPMRNKTMALLSDATIIVEATEKSGTRHQGWEALKIGRLVFLLENVIIESKLSWASDMIKYGAQTLTRDDFPHVIELIPSFTAESKFELSQE